MSELSELEKREGIVKGLGRVYRAATLAEYSREELLRRCWPRAELSKLLLELDEKVLAAKKQE